MSTKDSGGSAWPELRFAEWRDSGATLQLWTQIVGKLRLALSPWLNHGWQVPLYVSARGLGSSAMHVGGGRLVEVEFDLVDHRLVIRSSDAAERGFALAPMSVASFYRRFMAELAAIGIRRPDQPACRTRSPIRFPSPTTRPMPPTTRRRCMRSGARWCRPIGCSAISAPASSARRARCICSGARSISPSPASPAGRRRLHPGGIPGLPDAVTREAYSHEVSSAGFWPGSDAYPQAAFYSYAYPSPAGFDMASVEPTGAFWAREMGEWLLPYEAVRSAADPDAALIQFLESTWRAAADLGRWDPALECALGVPARPRQVGAG